MKNIAKERILPSETTISQPAEDKYDIVNNKENNNEVVLSIEDLKTYFFVKEGIVKAVDGLTYDVRKGECVGLVGESACGKSVSSMSILRLIASPPGLIVGGRIIFKSADILKADEEQMRKIRGNQISMVFQDAVTSLNPVLKVGRQISESLMLHRNYDKDKAFEESIRLMKIVGIPDPEKRVNDYPHQLSGGMQQRIMISIALSCNPELIIADEPTTALDVTIQAQILELLNRLRKEFGISVILITHNLGIVARYADRLNVMYAGKIVESGLTEDVYLHPHHPYTAGLLASVPRLDKPKTENLRVIDGLPPNLLKLPEGCSFSPRCKYAIDRCYREKPELKRQGIGKEHFYTCFL